MSSPTRERSSRSPGQSPARKREQSNEEHRHKRARMNDNTEEEATSNSIKEAEDGKESKESSPKVSKSDDSTAPPLPNELPPLPMESIPESQQKEEGEAEEDDGWAPIWDANAQAYYFYNRFTSASQWTNPRVPEASETIPVIPPAPGTEPTQKKPSNTNTLTSPPPPTSEALPAGGYNPAIHGDYDPNAWYAQTATPQLPLPSGENPASTDPAAQYAATAAFNRFTGRFQNAELTPENYNDDNKSKRQMNAFFDVDAAANSHEGKSLKAERSGKKLSKTELKQFKEKKRAKKEEKRRAWLKD